MSEQEVTLSEGTGVLEAGHHFAHPHVPQTGSIPRRVFNLAWPVISENFLETLLGIVDTWLVASLGAVAIAGFFRSRSLCLHQYRNAYGEKSKKLLHEWVFLSGQMYAKGRIDYQQKTYFKNFLCPVP